MSKIKNFEQFINEGLDNAEEAGVYDHMSDLLDRANKLMCKYDGTDCEETEIINPDEALELLSSVESNHILYSKAQELYDEIETLNNQTDSLDAEEFYEEEPEEFDDMREFEQMTNEKKKINDGFQAFLDKKNGKKKEEDDDDDDEDDDKKKKGKKAPKAKDDDDDDDEDKKRTGLTAKQKKLPEALQKAILSRMKKK